MLVCDDALLTVGGMVNMDGELLKVARGRPQSRHGGAMPGAPPPKR
jgi:hypothetical protein